MELWKKCSSCKKDIGFNEKYFLCSVSSCNDQRTGYVFCSPHCFERHLPGARHRDAAAIEERSPKAAASSTQGVRRIIPNQAPASPQLSDQDVLIVVSKLKAYIKQRADMNTSANVMDILSHKVRRLCDDAIDKARSEGRKTLMDRDFS